MVEKKLKVVLRRRKASPSGELEVLEKELAEVSYDDELRIGNVVILVDGFGRLCILSGHGQILIDDGETLLEDGTFVVPSYSGARVQYEQEEDGGFGGEKMERRVGIWNEEVSHMVRKVLLGLLRAVDMNPYAYYDLGVKLVEVAAKIAQLELSNQLGKERNGEGLRGGTDYT